jgi:hypothetical protein
MQQNRKNTKGVNTFARHCMQALKHIIKKTYSNVIMGPLGNTDQNFG